MHRISHVSITNFRACREILLPLEDYTPLVGQNNTGKSTILKAIQWILKPGKLPSNDFTDTAKPLTVEACIEGISDEVLNGIPEKKHRKAINPYCKDGVLWIRAVANKPNASVIQQIWDCEKYSGQDVPKEWKGYPTGIPQAVSALMPSALFVEAMEDVGEDLGKAKAGTTIKGLLDEIIAPVIKAHTDLNEAVGKIRSILSTDGEHRSSHLQDFDRQATEALTHFFPGLSLDLDLKVVEIKELFKAGDLHVTDSVTGDRRRFDQVGTGAQRSIQMALIRYLAENRSQAADSASRRLLLIDEPELYLHPQAVRRLRQALGTLSQAGFQVVFASHSPLMLSRENAADTVIVGKTKDGNTEITKPLSQAVKDALEDAQSQARTLFELGNLAEIYFAEKVVLCEGKTDRRVLPLAYERYFGNAPELDQIAFVSLGSCSDIPKALPVLTAMGIKAYAIADLDFAFTHARRGGNPLLPKDDENIDTVKEIFQRLGNENAINIDGNGLPNNKGTGVSASDAWAVLATDSEGKNIVQTVHDQLKNKNIWVWSKGCIEHVTGHQGKKGETAIVEQENRLISITSEQIGHEMSDLIACFNWVKEM